MKTETINFLGIEVEAEYDEDTIITSAKVGDCEIFEELLKDYYVEQLQECLNNHLEEEAQSI